jgi:ethanolamine utilization protein EutA
VPADGALEAVAEAMAARLFEAVGGAPMTAAAQALHRLEPLPPGPAPDLLMFSGGVAEYIYGREARRFGDLGPLLADAVLARMRRWGPILRFGSEGIRATVVGASQNTVQVSGTTIYVTPPEVLPLVGLAVIAPDLPLQPEVLDPLAIAAAIGAALRRRDLTGSDTPVALFYRWAGSATHARLDAFSRGVGLGLGLALAGRAGQLVVLIGDGDVGGLVGLQCRALADSVVSIDGITLRDFDFCDIGAPLDASGALPVVIKSLVFPGEAGAPGLPKPLSRR